METIKMKRPRETPGKTMKKIEVTPSIRSVLIEEFRVTEKTIWNALNYKTGGYSAEQIRRRALELGGKAWVQEPTQEQSISKQ